MDGPARPPRALSVFTLGAIFEVREIRRRYFLHRLPAKACTRTWHQRR